MEGRNKVQNDHQELPSLVEKAGRRNHDVLCHKREKLALLLCLADVRVDNHFLLPFLDFCEVEVIFVVVHGKSHRALKLLKEHVFLCLKVRSVPLHLSLLLRLHNEQLVC